MKNYFFLAPVFILLISSCVDLRTKVSKKNPAPDKAKQLMMEMGEAHGVAEWKKLKTYTAIFEEEFYGKLGERSSPYPETKMEFKLQYIPGTFDGRMIFNSSEKKGEIWGIQSWKTYTSFEQDLDLNDRITEEKHKDAYFWIPTYQYFIEFPYRIQEANALAFAGEETIEGKACYGIIASWGKVKPQMKTDQYLIWIEKDTKRIRKLEYTIREITSFIKGAAILKDYKDYNGILLPSVMSVESNLVKEGYLHEMRIKSFEANTVKQTDLRPLKIDPVGDKKEK